MIDYSITITDDDGDTVTFSHDFDAPTFLMLEASGLVVSNDEQRIKTILVTLKKNHIRALHTFLGTAYQSILVSESEESANV